MVDCRVAASLWELLMTLVLLILLWLALALCRGAEIGGDVLLA